MNGEWWSGEINESTFATKPNDQLMIDYDSVVFIVINSWFIIEIDDPPIIGKSMSFYEPTDHYDRLMIGYYP